MIEDKAFVFQPVQSRSSFLINHELRKSLSGNENHIIIFEDSGIFIFICSRLGFKIFCQLHNTFIWCRRYNLVKINIHYIWRSIDFRFFFYINIGYFFSQSVSGDGYLNGFIRFADDSVKSIQPVHG